MSLSFDCGKDEKAIIFKIAKRAAAVCKKNNIKFDLLSSEMDLMACHANGCPLELERMLEADDVNLMHDVLGIRRHISRKTGKLKHCFLPRFARPRRANGKGKT